MGIRLKEGGKINRSLLALNNVFASLERDSKYINYRESKLTHLLKDPLTNSSHTVIIANVNPSLRQYEETRNIIIHVSRLMKASWKTPTAKTHAATIVKQTHKEQQGHHVSQPAAAKQKKPTPVPASVPSESKSTVENETTVKADEPVFPAEAFDSFKMDIRKNIASLCQSNESLLSRKYQIRDSLVSMFEKQAKLRHV
ncbi:unnamed protein product [Soboliphyme baturini]|uniref:Kinesin motor domain-containing protein n=1 Tax=Soboliphyme baturini TaxID=241478 RepID=A0A183J2N8_9BILA|nr:unnamed protein product [Soboliphyme baturini]